MRGPPGSRAPRFLPPKDSDAGGGEGGGPGGLGGGGGGPAKPKKASRLMLYLRLRHREVLRLAAIACGSGLLLFLLVWLLISLSDRGGGEELHSAEDVKLNGGLIRGATDASLRGGRKRVTLRSLLRRRRGTHHRFFSGMGKLRGGSGRGGVTDPRPLPLVRNPYTVRDSGAVGGGSASTNTYSNAVSGGEGAASGTGGVSREGGVPGTGLLAGKGTDVYEASRESEILGRWDRLLGLEVDTWDPRTHDPDHPEQKTLGAIIDAKASKQQQQGEKQGRGVLRRSAGSSKQASAGSARSASAVQKPHYLTIVTYNRVFPEDPSNISAYECVQWVEFYRYAGASHIVWYDTSSDLSNSVFVAMKPFIDTGFLTYMRFNALFPSTRERDMHEEQDKSTIHALETYGPSAVWMAAMDVDEYVVAPSDTKPGFLERYLRVYEQRNPEASQLLLQSFLFIGSPEQPLPALLLERYTLRGAESEGVSLQPDSMMKPVVRPECVRLVYWQHPQHMEMAQGKTMALPAQALRINHYWGPRLPEFEFRDKLVRDVTAKEIAKDLTQLVARSWRKKGFQWLGRASG